MPVSARKIPAVQPERSRPRRERRIAAARQPVVHVVAPGFEVAREMPRKGETVTAFLRRTGWAYRDPKYGWQFRKGLPTILEVNGECVLRKDWRKTRIAANDNVRFVSFPNGGGKGGFKQVVGLVALVALAAFAAPLAGAALGAMGISASTAVIGGLTAGQLATGALLLGGSLLISALTAPKPGATNDPDAKVDQIYSVQAQGNAARLGQPLPVWYGRLKHYADFAASPWGEFIGNDQYLNVLLSTTVGKMSYETLFVDDTPMWTAANGVLPGFSSAEVAFYEPGEQVTLFPVNVHQAAEVTGQQLPNGAPGEWLGGFIANPSGTKATAIAVDFVFPAGCFRVNQENGNTMGAIVTLSAQYRPVDDAGAPLDSWSALFHVTRVYANRSPIRDGVKEYLPPGRYEVRFRRETPVPDQKEGSSEVVWAGMRAFLQGDNRFPVSTVAIRIKASESTQGSFRFGVLGTRKLPVWNGSTFVEQATRNPVWAALDVATNTTYGAGHALSKVDFNAIVNHALAADARSDRFDYIFSAAEAVPDAIDKALTVTRAKHFWLGDTLSVVRDEWRDVPAMMLTDREIVRDSVEIGVELLTERDPDAVVIEYVDENTWRPASVQYPPDQGAGGFNAVQAETKRLDGIVNRNHAFREAAFYYLQSIYRREFVSLKTEYEGRAVTFGQVLRVQSELPMSYGQSGAVVEVDGSKLTLDPVPTWAVGEQHFVRLRRRDGRLFGPVKVTRGIADNQAVLDADDLTAVEGAQGTALTDVLARADGAEWPSFELGTATNQSRLAMVLGGQPEGPLAKLSLVVDDERVHATDIGSPPILPTPSLPANPRAPLIVGLNARWDGGGVAEPKLVASWSPAPGAFYYRAEVSFDGNLWTQVYEGQANTLDVIVTPAALTLRVQAIGAMTGPWSEAELGPPTIQIRDNTVAFESLKESLREHVTTILDQRFAEDRERQALMARLVQEALARTSIDKREVRTQLQARSENALAEISRVEQVAVDAEVAVAQLEETVGAEFGPVKAQVITNTSAIATIEGYAAAQWSVLTDVNGNVAGLVLFNEGASKSSFDVIATAFRVCWPGVSGGDPVPVFTVANVNGVAKLALRGDMLVDGQILARMVAAGQINGVHIEAQSINTSQLAINSVGIDQIIQNAVTNTKVFSVGASGNHNDSFFSQSVDIQSGAANVTYCASHNLEKSVGFEDLSSLRLIIDLIIDGTLRKSWTWLTTAYSNPPDPTIFHLNNPFTVQYTYSGLSRGSHSFTLRARFDTEMTLGSTAIQPGQIFVADFRR